MIWSLNLDMSIRSYDFQRCRSVGKNELLKDFFRKNIEGKKFYDILQYSKDLRKIPHFDKLSTEAKELCEIFIRSALKTLALTELTWKENLLKLRLSNLIGDENENSFKFHDRVIEDKTISF